MNKIIVFSLLLFLSNSLIEAATAGLQKCTALAKEISKFQRQPKRVEPVGKHISVPKRVELVGKHIPVPKRIEPANSNNVQVIRVPVLQQTGGAVCGYHALLNVIVLKQYLSWIPYADRCSVDVSEIEALKNRTSFNTSLTALSKQILELRETSPLGGFSSGSNWLRGDEIEFLKRSLALSPEILVMEEYPTRLFDIDTLQKIWNFLMGPIGDMLGFIWNVGGVQDTQSGIHWTGFVALKCAGGIKLFAMDSASRCAVMFENNAKALLSHTPEQIQQMIHQEKESAVYYQLKNLFHEQRSQPATISDFFDIFRYIDQELILNQEVKDLALEYFGILWDQVEEDNKKFEALLIQNIKYSNRSAQELLNTIKGHWNFS